MCGFEVIEDKIEPASAGVKLFECIRSIFSFFIIFLPVFTELKRYLRLSEKLGGKPPLYSKVGGIKTILIFLSLM